MPVPPLVFPPHVPRLSFLLPPVDGLLWYLPPSPCRKQWVFPVSSVFQEYVHHHLCWTHFHAWELILFPHTERGMLFRKSCYPRTRQRTKSQLSVLVLKRRKDSIACVKISQLTLSIYLVQESVKSLTHVVLPTKILFPSSRSENEPLIIVTGFGRKWLCIKLWRI